MKLKLTLILVGLAAVGCIALFSAQSSFGGDAHIIERFIQRKDGWVIGILNTNGTMVLSSDIKEISWTAENGANRVIRWDGTNVTVR